MGRLTEIREFPVNDWTKSIPKGCFIDRDESIVALCAGKTVLHVGAADAPFDLDKGLKGELLHQKIQSVAARVVGVDIDRDAISALRSVGIDDIIEADICDGDRMPGESFDVVLCCDVIEHVSTPGPLLAGCRRHMRSDSELVVSTINATALKPALRALGNREAVHFDHVAYFSFATLGKQLTMEGLCPVEFGMFAYPTVNRLAGWLTRILFRIAPATADGVIMTARLI